jgi:hypothetical protein
VSNLEIDATDSGEELEVPADEGPTPGGDPLIGAYVGDDGEAAGWGGDRNGPALSGARSADGH